MKVKIKKLHKDAVIPTYAYDTDAGCDLTAVSVKETEKYIEYNTGISVQPPEGYYFEIFPRSSLSNYDLILANSVGIIDNKFIGEIRFRFKKTKDNGDYYNIGNKIGQMILKKKIDFNFIEVDSLKETVRGGGGYGSTGE